MCHFETSWVDPKLQFEGMNDIKGRLEEMEKDGLVEFKENGIVIPEVARPFVRNICMAFDKKIHQKKIEKQLFSMTI